MEATTNSPVEVLSPIEVLDSFFSKYPAEKAEALLWRWFILSIKDEFSKLPPSELDQFTDFFERLDNMILATHIVSRQKKGTGWI